MYSCNDLFVKDIFVQSYLDNISMADCIVLVSVFTHLEKGVGVHGAEYE